MPTVLFPAGTMQADVNYTVDGIPCANVLGINTTSGSAAVVADGLTVGDDIATWLAASIAPNQTNEVVYDNCRVIDLTSVTGWSAIVPITLVGSQVARAVANQVALVTTLSTDFRGRSFRGRQYLPGFPASDLDSGIEWSAALVAAIQTAYEDLESALFAHGFQIVVLSRVHLGAPRVTGVATPVTAFESKILPATIRGRLT